MTLELELPEVVLVLVSALCYQKELLDHNLVLVQQE